MADTPWHNMAPQSTPPSEAGTKRDFANMLNQKLKKKKLGTVGKQTTHWELPKKLKLDGF